MKRRDAINMTQEEIAAFLAGRHTATLVSLDTDGYPHAAAMWYVLSDGLVTFATYAKSQKIKNLERNPKAAVLVEAGDAYGELHGVMIQGDAELRTDPVLAGEVMIGMSERYWALDLSSATEEQLEVVRQRGSKRTLIRIHPNRVRSWDHRKLGGAY